ncbi:MAG: hypothetical protein PHS41_01595 [Victivallaceae bacterium]|nr:hypothetical protein [Victivallaceae bacterium]
MYGRQYNHENWSEYQWERQIRADERRISRYFAELPKWMDLPGEEELISEEMSDDRGRVTAPAATTRNFFGSGEEEEFDDEGSDVFDETLLRRSGGEFISAVDALFVEWNILGATVLAGESVNVVRITCAFGKLQARLIELAALDEAAPRMLRVTLVKRAIADLCEVDTLLRHVSETNQKAEKPLRAIIESLMCRRERLIDFMRKLRRS